MRHLKVGDVVSYEDRHYLVLSTMNWDKTLTHVCLYLVLRDDFYVRYWKTTVKYVDNKCILVGYSDKEFTLVS
jgi:hypothetical protein